MSDNTGISWTDHTFNPITGCVKVSPGCKNCYAERLDGKFSKVIHWGHDTERKIASSSYWEKPKRWNKAAKKRGVPARVFCASMGDVFEDHPIVRQEVVALWKVIKETPWLQWQLLTKRPENIQAYLPDDWGDGYPNVWLGVSIENDEWGWRRDFLASVPAVVHFISYEPALGPLERTSLEGIDWVIYGGESGPGRRKDDPVWPLAMWIRCHDEGVAFFMKQTSAQFPGQIADDVDEDVAKTRAFPTPHYVSGALEVQGGMFL